MLLDIINKKTKGRHMNDAMNTMIGNQMGMGGGDAVYRDMVGDNSNGAMGTMVGRSQGAAADAMSDYMQGSQSEIQVGLNMMDTMRGYEGAGGNIEPALETSDISNMRMDTGGPSLMTPALSSPTSSSPTTNRPVITSTPMMSDMGSAIGAGVDLTQQPMQIGAGAAVAGITSSIIPGGAGGDLTAGGIKPSGPTIAKAQGILEKKTVLVSGGSKTMIGASARAPIPTSPVKTAGPGLSSINNAGAHQGETKKKRRLEEDDDEGTPDREPAPDLKGIAQTGNIRPTTPPKMATKRRKKKTIEEQVLGKLQRLNEDEFLRLVETTDRLIKESPDRDERLKAHCKMGILRKEADRRMRTEGFTAA